MTVNIANLVNSYGTNYEILTSAAFLSMALPLVIFFAFNGTLCAAFWPAQSRAKGGVTWLQ